MSMDHVFVVIIAVTVLLLFDLKLKSAAEMRRSKLEINPGTRNCGLKLESDKVTRQASDAVMSWHAAGDQFICSDDDFFHVGPHAGR